MPKRSLALICLPIVFAMAGCATNAGGLVPSPLAQSGDRAAVESNGDHRGEPDAGSSIVEFKFASTGLNFLTPDFRGNEWFAAADPLAMVSINENTGAFSKHNLPASHSGPFGIAINAAHNVLWFTEPDSNAVAYMNLYNDTVGAFAVPTNHAKPEGITAGPGTGIWFTEARSGKIGKIDAVTQKFSEYKVPSASKPYRITLGPDGALWFTNLRSIGRIATNGHIQIYPIGQNDPTGITTGPDGGVWFTGKSDHNGSLLGRIDPATHARKLYKYASGDGGNEDIAVRDSDFWMTRPQGNRIDRFDHLTHIIHSRPLPHGYTRPFGIALGADDQIWFVNNGPATTAIGKLCPDLPEQQCKTAP